MRNATYTLGDYLEPVQHRLSEALIDPQALSKVRAFADQVPGQVSSFFGFECPISDNTKVADLLFCSTQKEGHSRILAGLHRSIDLPGHFLDLPAWRRVREFCHIWEDVQSDLHDQLLNVWLEFDIGQSTAPYSPSLFFGTSTASHQDPRFQERLLYAALQPLAPEALQDARGEALQRSLKSVEKHAGHVFQAGVMLAREMPAIRLCIRGVSPDAVIPMLVDCGWQSEPLELASLIERYRNRCVRMDVDLDVGATIGPKIGIECSFGRELDARTVMSEFLKCLVEDDLATRTVAEALLDYNGAELQDTCPDRWNEHLLRLAALQGRNITNVIACWLHHVKLVHQSGRPLGAKAYLAVQADFMQRQELRQRLEAVRAS